MESTMTAIRNVANGAKVWIDTKSGNLCIDFENANGWYAPAFMSFKFDEPEAMFGACVDQMNIDDECDETITTAAAARVFALLVAHAEAE